MLAAAFASLGCDVGPKTFPGEPPDVHLVEVLVTTGVDADGAPLRARVADDGTTTGVLGTSSLALRFDRFLDPITATRQAICLQPVLAPVSSYLECQGVDFLQPSYDPVWREVVFRQAAGARLQAQTRYQLTVFRPPDDASPGFRAFDGPFVERSTTLQFTTAAEDPPLATDERPGFGDRWCEDAPCRAGCDGAASVRACVDACGAGDAACAETCTATCRSACGPGVATILRACATGGCHGPSAEGGPAMGLDFATPAGVEATALGHVAHQTQAGEHAARAETRPLRFGRAMPVIAPGYPGNSYALYKLVVGEAYASSPASPGGEEIARLRDALVVGMPMPPQAGAWPGLDAIGQVTTWIGLGAATRACP